MKITNSCMALVALFIITSLTTAQDQNRSLAGSADFGDAGRHMGVTSLGTLTVTGDNVAANQAHVIRIAGNGFAYLPNGIVLRNPNASEVAFDGPNQSHNLEVFFLGTGAQNIGGAYDVDVSLPAANSFVNGNGDSVVAYGGNWFGSAEYNKLDGSSQTFTADDLSNTDNSISPLTLMVAPDKAHASSIFNRTDSPRPEIPTTIQDPNSPLDFNLKFGQTPLLERQNTLFQVDAPAEGVAAPVLDLSQISVKAQGTSLRDRVLNGQIIDLGRSIATNDSSTESINRTDNVVVTTFGDDDLRTRLSLSNFVESADGLTATLNQTQDFNSADSEATVQLQANFDIDRSQTGTFLKTVDVGNHISGEELTGENAQSSLGVGYQYGVVEENGAVSNDVTVFTLDGDTAVGTTITNFSAAKEFSRNTHTDIQVNNQATLDGTAQQTVSLSKDNGITGEGGLVGEQVTATTQYDIHRVSVASSQIQSNAGLIGEGNIELENMRSDGAGREAEAILIDGQRVGSTRWTVEFDGWDSRLSAGESVELTTAFDDSGLPENATLGRNFRTRVDLTFQDGSFDLDAWAIGDSDVARVNSESTFDIVGSDATRQTHSWLLEKTNEVTGKTGRTQLAAGTSLRDEGLNLTNSSGEQTTLTLLDSGRLSGPREVSVEFTNKNEASQTLSDASGFDGLISDIVNLTGLDGFMHVVELSYDPALLPGGSQAIVSWFDEGENSDQDAWVNATLGNSNIDSYDLLSNEVIIDGNSLLLDEYLEGNRFESSYSEYLLSLAPSDVPVLGAFGFDEEQLTAWAVIDHNSSFSTASISAVPEPSSMVALLSTLPWLFRRRRVAN